MKSGTFFKYSPWILALFMAWTPHSWGFEMLGLISYNLGVVSPKPSNFTQSSNGIGYTFLGRLDLGPGKLESGFQFVPTSIQTQQLKITGTYWILPIMYRYWFVPPFFSIAAGADYGVVGTNNLSFSGAVVNGLTTGYRSHFGAQISLEAAQDLGENISAVLDLRYRSGLASAISIGNEESRYHFWILALGIQKHLD